VGYLDSLLVIARTVLRAFFCLGEDESCWFVDLRFCAYPY
jgi:hypothetical protein